MNTFKIKYIIMNPINGRCRQYCLYILISAGLFVMSCRKKYETIELPRIEYDVLLNNYGNNYSWFDHIDGFSRIEFFQNIIDAAKSGKFKIEDMRGNSIKPENVDSFLTIQVTDSSELLRLDPEKLNGLRFRESWKIDSGSGLIVKDVIAICPLYFHHHPLKDDGQAAKVFPVFWIYPIQSDVKKNMVVLTEKIAYDVIMDNTLAMICESYGSQLPFYFNNIETSYRIKIVNALLDAGFQKRTPSLNFMFSEIPDQELQSIESRNDTMTVWNDRTGKSTDSVLVNNLDRNQVIKLKFAEQWSFDKHSLVFTKKSIAIAPSALSYDETGELKGFRFLFWLLFEKDMKKKLHLN